MLSGALGETLVCAAGAALSQGAAFAGAEHRNSQILDEVQPARKSLQQFPRRGRRKQLTCQHAAFGSLRQSGAEHRACGRHLCTHTRPCFNSAERPCDQLVVEADALNPYSPSSLRELFTELGDIQQALVRAQLGGCTKVWLQRREPRLDGGLA